MAPGAGIASQVGFVTETTVGSAGTPDHFPEFTGETVNFVKGILQGQGLHAGGFYNRAARRVVSTKAAAGDITMDHATKKMNFFWKHILGSTPTFTQQGATTAWTAVHQPGSADGSAFTYQKGVPQTNGTVQPFTFNGGKVTSATFSVTDQQIAQLVMSMDFWNVATGTALAAASYPAGNEVYNFSQASTFTLGGTASTSGGVVSIASGVAATTLFKGFSVTFAAPKATGRYGLGNSGIKKEQIENAYKTITGTLDGEFTSRTEIWDLMQADTTTALHLQFVGSNIASTYYNTLDFVFPAVKFNTADISVGGPDIVQQSVPFEVLDDGVNAVCQVSITSTDTAL